MPVLRVSTYSDSIVVSADRGCWRKGRRPREGTKGMGRKRRRKLKGAKESRVGRKDGKGGRRKVDEGDRKSEKVTGSRVGRRKVEKKEGK